MVYLHRSALWRSVVVATRDPRILTAFIVTTVAGAYTIGKGSQMLTEEAAEQTKEDLEKKLRKDREAARYASHSKNALALLFENVKREDRKGSSGDVDPDAKYKKHAIRLPGVVWHPRVAEKDRARARAAEMEREGNATGGSDVRR